MDRADTEEALATIRAAIRDAGRDPLASEQRRIDYLEARLAELDHSDGLERVLVLQREWNDRGAEVLGLIQDDMEGAPRWRP